MPPRNVVPEAACRSRTRRCGSRAAAATRSTSPRRRASARSSFAFIDPEEAKHWVDDYYATLAAEECVPIGDAVNPNVACVTHVHVPRRRGRGASTAASRAPTSSATRSRTTTCSAGTSPASPTCGTSSRQRRAEHGYDPEAVVAAAETRTGSAPRSCEQGIGGAARRGRHARPDPRLPARATRSAASTR